MVRRGRKRPANKNETARIPCPEGAEGSGAIEQVQPGVAKGDGEVTIQAVRQGTAPPSGIAAPIACAGLHIEPAAEHAPERLQERTERYAGPVDIDCTRRKHGRGRCEGIQQRRSEKPAAYAKKPGGSAEKLRICGTGRNGDSKTNRRARVGCGGCPYAGQCKKADRNRASRPDRELSAMRREALESMESVHGALLRMNRSTQAEGMPGVLKHDRNHKRIVRGGLASRSRSLVWLLSVTTCTNAITKAPAPKPQPEEFRCIGARGLGASHSPFLSHLGFLSLRRLPIPSVC